MQSTMIILQYVKADIDDLNMYSEAVLLHLFYII